MSFLANLPAPNVIDKLDYVHIKEQITDIFKDKFPDYQELESDPYTTIIEAIAYRELLLRARINDSILSMLIAFATGSDLDHLVALYGVERLKGAKPTTVVNFKLTALLPYSVTIPKDTIFRSSAGDIARLVSDVIIPANTQEVEGVLELDQYVKTSKVKTEYIQTPLPFLEQVTQAGDYDGGGDPETDEAFRERAILSLDRFSTAGSVQAYKYYAKSAHVNIEEVAVLGEHPAGIVKIYIKTVDNVTNLISYVTEILNREKVRPLTDKVEVYNATRKTLTVSAKLGLLDMSRRTEIEANIKATKKRFALGEDVNLSYLYKTLHQEGVYRVAITAPTSNQLASENEFYEITWNLSWEVATW
jgi:phage-related baseplate assembly protein